jgi:hypothetical protein
MTDKQYITNTDALKIYNKNRPKNAYPYKSESALAERMHSYGFGDLDLSGHVNLTIEDVMDYITALRNENQKAVKRKRLNDPRLGISAAYLRYLRGESNLPQKKMSYRAAFDQAQMDVLLEEDE